MAKCGSCNSDSSRVRTSWMPDGTQKPDECPQCAPQSFDRFRSVRDGKIAMGWEYMPKRYKLRNGVYEGTDELRADTEAQLSKQPEEDVAAYNKAVEAKRATRRTVPLTSQEQQQCIAWFHAVQDEALESGKSLKSN